MIEEMTIGGILLAGGGSRRFAGREKGFLPFAGRPLLQTVRDLAAPQVTDLIISANGDPARFASLGLPVIADETTSAGGPLSGISAGLRWIERQRPACRWAATFPADTPFLPTDMVERLLAVAKTAGAPLAYGSYGGRGHPVCGLWSLDLAEALRRAVTEEGLTRVFTWMERMDAVAVPWDHLFHDPFFNINDPQALAEAERLMKNGRTV